MNKKIFYLSSTIVSVLIVALLVYAYGGSDPTVHGHSSEEIEDFVHMKTGSYVGDGTNSQAITGVGFQPKYLKIWQHVTSEGNYRVFEKMDQSWGDYAMFYYRPAVGQSTYDNNINSLDADGFTVDDDGTDSHPNMNGVTYDYLALG